MVSYFPYNPISDIEVSETLTVKNSRVLLRHIPKEGSIKIRGFVEVDSTVLVPYQFHCAYSTETHYREANRIINFNAQHNGATLTINYVAVGTVFTAEDANEIKAHLENDSIHSSYTLPTASAQVKGGVKIGDNLVMNGELLSASVPTASAAVKGGIKIGSNLTMSGEVLSANSNIIFKGSMNALPALPTLGWLVYVEGKFYLGDGANWLPFCTCEKEVVPEFINHKKVLTGPNDDVIYNGDITVTEPDAYGYIPDWQWGENQYCGDGTQITLPEAFRYVEFRITDASGNDLYYTTNNGAIEYDEDGYEHWYTWITDVDKAVAHFYLNADDSYQRLYLQTVDFAESDPYCLEFMNRIGYQRYRAGTGTLTIHWTTNRAGEVVYYRADAPYEE